MLYTPPPSRWQRIKRDIGDGIATAAFISLFLFLVTLGAYLARVGWEFGR